MSTRIGYVETVSFTGASDSKTVEAKCDTGAKRTSICHSLGEEIGLGEPVGSVIVHSSNGSQERDIYEIQVTIDGVQHDVEVSVTDRKDMNYDAIVGRDVLQDYLVDSSEMFLFSE